MLDCPRILIVEDELIVALELEERLRRQGYAIAGVSRTAADALALVSGQGADLALLDVRLAGARDGIELAADLRAWDIPAVFLTAHGDDETLNRIKAVDAQGYLLKPFDERLLRLTIETALHRHASERARSEAERARRRSEAMQASILAHSPDAVLVVAGSGAIELGNPAARALFMSSEDTLSDRRLDDLLPGLTVEHLRSRIGAPLSCSARRGERSFPVELSVGVLPTEAEAQLLLFIRDVSAQRQLEQDLAFARQLEVAGRLASGVAHDLNNLLSVVGMTSYMLPGASAQELPHLLEDLTTAVELGTTLTTKILVLARRGVGCSAARPVAVNEALRALERLIRRMMAATVAVELDLDPRAGRVSIDPAQLDQIVLNFSVNARRAMPDGGRLSLRTRVEVDEERGWVRIEVEDTGIGMDQTVQRRLFEPFFTTRGDAGGTGLGLSIVKEIVDGADGTLDFESTPGIGTCFRVRLPLCPDGNALALSVDAEAEQGSARIGLGRTALLVDDDEVHRRALARLLESWGFRTVQAGGAGEAILIAERREGDLDLAFVDIEMPYMDGYELAGRLEALRRQLPVLLLSGSGGRRLPKGGQGGEARLRKPVEPKQLMRTLARMFDPEETR